MILLICRLLVWILLISFIFRHKSIHDNLICLSHSFLFILHSFAFWHYGLVDSKRERMPYNPFHVPCTGHDVKRAIYSNWTYWQLELVSKHKCSPAEFSHVSCKTAASLWEYNYGHTLAQYLSCLVISLLYSAGTSFINENMIGCLTSLSDKWNVA